MAKLREPEVPVKKIEEEVCVACDGTGVVKSGSIFDQHWRKCPKCKGEGKVVKADPR